jgi:diguanylate cyclase (GGDEF)-like protein
VATQKSLTDALTGLYNRDYLGQQLQTLLEEGHSGALFMIDLDNFKTMNDTYGHIIGDKTLQYFAEVLRQYAEEKDIVCRLAGDEFVTFYTDTTDRAIIAKKAEGIIKEFSEKMGELGYPGVVSVSIGIMITDGGETFQTLYNKADKSLYFVKNNGKNAYHFYGENKESLKEINTLADMEAIRHIMEEGLEDSKGAYRVAYSEFKGIYDFVGRYADRKKQKLQIWKRKWRIRICIQIPSVQLRFRRPISRHKMICWSCTRPGKLLKLLCRKKPKGVMGHVVYRYLRCQRQRKVYSCPGTGQDGQ